MKHLYCAHMIHVFEVRSGRQDVWHVLENMVLIVATSAPAAIRKAMHIGARLDELDHKSMRVNGRPVRERFRGLRKVMTCTWDLPKALKGRRAKRAVTPARLDEMHGAEVSYSFFVIRGRRNLEAYLRGEEVELTYEA